MKEQIKFSIKAIKEIRKALKDESAGNSQCTMTDLDLACDMLDELVLIKNEINKLSK
jgi:hypothetical protein